MPRVKWRPGMGAGRWAITIDLGKRVSGVAVFDNTGVLRGATELIASPLTRVMAMTILFWARSVIGGDVDDQDVDVVFEKMRKYRGHAARGRHLDHLTEVGQRIRVLASGARVLEAPASAWKGAVPKRICRDRAVAILDDAEFGRIVVWGKESGDAVSMGLVHIGRAGRGVTSG